MDAASPHFLRQAEDATEEQQNIQTNNKKASQNNFNEEEFRDALNKIGTYSIIRTRKSLLVSNLYDF